MEALKIILEKLESITKFEAEMDIAYCDCCSPSINLVESERFGDLIKVEDLKKIIEELKTLTLN